MELTNTEHKNRLMFIAIIDFLNKNYEEFTQENLAALFDISPQKLNEIKDLNIGRFIPYYWINIIVNLLTPHEIEYNALSYKPTLEQKGQFIVFKNVLRDKKLDENFLSNLKEFEQIRNDEHEQRLKDTSESKSKKGRPIKRKLLSAESVSQQSILTPRAKELKLLLDCLTPYLEVNGKKKLIASLNSALRENRLDELSSLLKKISVLQKNKFSMNPNCFHHTAAPLNLAEQTAQSTLPTAPALSSANVIGHSLTKAITQESVMQTNIINFTKDNN